MIRWAVSRPAVIWAITCVILLGGAVSFSKLALATATEVELPRLRINAQWPPYEAALKAAGVKHSAFIYAGAQHGFNNDTTPRFDEKSARQAWGRMLALFNRALRG